jgi:hypothetical protein
VPTLETCNDTLINQHFRGISIIFRRTRTCASDRCKYSSRVSLCGLRMDHSAAQLEPSREDQAPGRERKDRLEESKTLVSYRAYASPEDDERSSGPTTARPSWSGSSGSSWGHH